MRKIGFCWYVKVNGCDYEIVEKTFDTYKECEQSIKEHKHYQDTFVTLVIDDEDSIEVLYEFRYNDNDDKKKEV